MARVLLSLGSNIDRERNIQGALAALRNAFGTIECSPVYESVAVGFDGDPFLNLVVLVHTELSVGQLSAVLHAIEDQYGRTREGARFSARTLDIDILTYDDVTGVIDGVKLPRGEILKNAFVLLPMADLVPEDVHPVQQKSYAALWQAFDKTSQKLWQVPFVIEP